VAAAKDLPRPRHRWYAAFYAKCLEPSDRKTIGPIRRMLAGGAHGRVLEIGAGTGANLEYYDWPRVEALDLTEPDPYMARYLQPRLDTLPPEVRARVRLSDAPAERLPFPDESFDCVVVTLVLCSVADLDGSIAELRRVLKPDGDLRLLEHVRGEGLRARVQSLVQPVYGWTSGECQLTRRTEDALRRGGFDLQVTQRRTLGPLWPVFVGTARKAGAT
jgi:SAM-dependent methyltransferase